MQSTCKQAKDHTPQRRPQQVDHQPQERRAEGQVEAASQEGGNQCLRTGERGRDSVQRREEAHLQVGGGGEHDKQHHQDPTEHADEGSNKEKVEPMTIVSCCRHSMPPLWFTRPPVAEGPGRPQGSPLLYTMRLGKAVYSRGGACPRPGTSDQTGVRHLLNTLSNPWTERTFCPLICYF